MRSLSLGLPILIVSIALFAPFGLFQSKAHAAGITVTTTNDELNTDGDCSLRRAIQAAKTDLAVDACSAGSGADIITLPAGAHTISIPGAFENANATTHYRSGGVNR